MAATLLEDQGPQALTVRTVAERARMSLDAVEPTPDPVADVVRQVHAYREAALARPGFYAIMFARPVPEFRPSAAALARARATIGGLVDALRRAIPDGGAAPHPEQAAQVIWGLNHGLVSLELDGHLAGGEQGGARLERAARDLLHSWSPSPGPGASSAP